ncbi:RhtX/FptX family siderophore transporter [Neisseriaceae bacterium CLB008]|nr:RhtX/FptX family siderophore transporter [Neisseriaceae bacterium]
MTQIHSPKLWLMIGLLYLTQGMPLGLAMDALPTLLRSQGASLAQLVWLPLVGLPWVLKFLWASRIDNHYHPQIGRRRSWLIPMQSIVLVCFSLAALVGIRAETTLWIMALAAVGSFASATQDIATDGLSAELFSGKNLARANALQVGGTMVGFFLGGPGTLMLMGHFGQHIGLMTPALIVAVSLVLLLRWRETSVTHPANSPAQPASLAGFIKRPGAPALLGVAGLSAVAMVAGYGLSKLLLVDAGWAVERIGQVGMLGGMMTVLLGCGGGAWLVGRYGSIKIFTLGLSAAIIACCLWLYGIRLGANIPTTLVWSATLLSCFGAGSASVALMTRAMQFAQQGQQAGTDMTAVQSTRDLGEITMSSSLMALAASFGYGGSFMVGIVCALIAIGLMARLRSR